MWTGFANLKVHTKQLIGFGIVIIAAVVMKALNAEDPYILGAAAALALLMSLLIANSIAAPMKRLSDDAARMAEGDLDVRFDTSSGNEAGRLAKALAAIAAGFKEQAADATRIAEGDLSVNVKVKSDKDKLGRSMQHIVDSLRELMAEMKKMSDEHEAGDIDVVVTADKFKGAYRTVAQGVNDMVRGHIAVKKRAMAIVAEFSVGNFDAELERFPGKKAFINDTIERLRSNVQSFIREMNAMSSEHEAGDIDVIIPVEKFEGAYKLMAQGVNDMVRGHIAVKKRAMAVVAEFSVGNFDAPLETFPGKKAFINENIELLRKHLKAVNEEIHMLIEASRAGQLSQRGDVGRFTGDWAAMVGGLNGLIDAMIEPIQEASAVLDEMAKGNLSFSVKGDYRGDHARIKHALNDTISTLGTYISEISDVMTHMADGNMDVEIRNDYRGDFAPIKTSLNDVIMSFNDLLKDMNNTASQVASGSMQVAGTAQLLSQGATEQASSIQQLTASLEEIGAQTKQNAHSAGEASTLAEKAKVNAVQGNDQMKQMLKAMDDMNEASGNISKIIKVIDEIAFQTNILALNAAVEAARAGQHGKGFAVVAEEVRNLAARSANAAKETTVLIEGSIRKVEDGTKIASETAGALNKIVEDVAKAADLVGEIATASSEQAMGIAQINQGISIISEVTQTNSASSEESATASEELSSQAELMKAMAGRFKLKKASGMRGYDGGHEPPVSGYAAYEPVHRPQAVKGWGEAAAAGGRMTIALSDREFGKY